MAQNRLKREQNPFNGNRAEIIPHQFDTTGQGDFENVSPQNPFPVTLNGGNGGGNSNGTQYIVGHEYINLENPINEYQDRYETDKACYLQSLTFFGDDKTTQCLVKLHSMGDENPYIKIGTANMTFDNLNEIGGDNGIFEIIKHDESENKFILTLKRPIYCPNGFYAKPNKNGATAQLSVVFFNEVD